MFKKVLIAEDLDSISIGVHSTLESLSISHIESSRYCDDALLKIKKSLLDKKPFDLLITDLSFKGDHRVSTLASGEDLIVAARRLLPDIAVIAYSIEDKPYKVKQLFEVAKINGYICKGRESTKEFLNALNTIREGKPYISPQLTHALRDSEPMEIDQNDVAILRHLMNGLLQEEIAERFKAEGRAGSSTSSIEKRINKLKIFFKAKTTIQLISIAKDMGVI